MMIHRSQGRQNILLYVARQGYTPAEGLFHRKYVQGDKGGTRRTCMVTLPRHISWLPVDRAKSSPFYVFPTYPPSAVCCLRLYTWKRARNQRKLFLSADWVTILTRPPFTKLSLPLVCFSNIYHLHAITPQFISTGDILEVQLPSAVVDPNRQNGQLYAFCTLHAHSPDIA